jgi:hypothetical protein
MSIADKDFTAALDDALATEVEPLKWFFVSFRDKASGVFTGALIVQAPRWMKAIDASFPFIEGLNYKIGETSEIPETQLPAEQYRNRVLNREEVEQIRSTQKAGTR